MPEFEMNEKRNGRYLIRVRMISYLPNNPSPIMFFTMMLM
jgi:hypothetical protein